MPKSTTQKRTPSSRKKRLIILAVCVILVLVIIPATALAYVGFIPVATEWMQTNKPVDLGVTYGAADYLQLEKNTSSNLGNYNHSYTDKQNVNNTSPGPQFIIDGANTTQATLTQEEITAFLNMTPWTASPVTNSQVRLSDGTLEFSGNVQASYVSSLIKSVYPAGNYGNLSFVLKMASHLQDPAIYLKASISVTQPNIDVTRGELHLKILALRVNRMDLSSEVANMNEVNFGIGEGSWQKGIPYSLTSLSIASGKLSFFGTIPSDYEVGSGDPSSICDGQGGVFSLVALGPVNGHIGSVVKTCNQ